MARVRKPEFARLAEISVSHLYNLRRSAGYRQRAVEFSRTVAAGVGIGKRRRPDPQGAPGYLRVDTVHQGGWEGAKGVYHINAVTLSRNGRLWAVRRGSASTICCHIASQHAGLMPHFYTAHFHPS